MGLISRVSSRTYRFKTSHTPKNGAPTRQPRHGARPPLPSPLSNRIWHPPNPNHHPGHSSIPNNFILRNRTSNNNLRKLLRRNNFMVQSHGQRRVSTTLSRTNGALQ